MTVGSTVIFNNFLNQARYHNPSFNADTVQGRSSGYEKRLKVAAFKSNGRRPLRNFNFSNLFSGLVADVNLMLKCEQVSKSLINASHLIEKIKIKNYIHKNWMYTIDRLAQVQELIRQLQSILIPENIPMLSKS
jgi:hypothetical protein